MSTRSIIVITGTNKYGATKTVRLYKHCDGYPTGNLDLIHAALNRGRIMNREYADRFKEKDASPLDVGQIESLIIGEAASPYGAGAYVDQFEDDSARYDGPFKPEHLGNQGDLEWIYVLNLDDKSIDIYGGGYTGKEPQHAFNIGVVSPLVYAKSLTAEYQDGERLKTMKLIQKLADIGFEVNKPKAKRVSKKVKG